MSFYEGPDISGIDSRETVYHTGNGFYNPYIEPEDKKERRHIRSAANGIGLAALGYVSVSRSLGAVCSLITDFIAQTANIRGIHYFAEAAESFFVILIYIVSLLIPFGIYAAWMKIPLNVAVPFRKSKTDITLSGILVSLGIGILASYAVSFLQIGFENIGLGITMPEYAAPENVQELVFNMITLAVVPAFLEEIVFRGIVMQNLRRFGDIFALVFSAIIFGVFHFNLIQMPYAFIMGLCMGYFVMRTGSIWVGILIHFINNAVAVVYEFFYPGFSMETMYIVNMVYNFVCALLSVCALVFLLLKYKDMFRFEPCRNVLSPEKKTAAFATAPFFVISMIVAFLMTLPYIYLI